MKACPICKARYHQGEIFCPGDGSRLTLAEETSNAGTDIESLIGVTLGGRYEVEEQIGEGGMGLVYRGKHVAIDKPIAIKVLRDSFTEREDVVTRFHQEARSASRIGHENIVDVSDFGVTPYGQHFFVMEFLRGEDLADRLARERRVEPVRAARIMIQCCRALGAAHDKHIVHRDMKPENIFLVERPSQEDFVKIVDFGIAKMSDIETPGEPGRKLTKTGMIFGTPEYMSPEQAHGHELDHRVDIYALGVILYEMVTGRVPFMGDSFMGVLTKHMFDPPTPIEDVSADVICPPELDAVIFRALAKDRDQRFQTMREFELALEAAIRGEIDEETDTFRAERREYLQHVEHGRRSNAWRNVAIFVGTVAVAAGLALLLYKPKPQGVARAVEPRPVALAAEDPSPTEEPTHATLRISTDPAGATVQLSGGSQAQCDATPCELKVPVKVALTINADLEGRTATREVTVERDRDIDLALGKAPTKHHRRKARSADIKSLVVAKKEAKGTKTKDTSAKTEKKTNKTAGGLKLPDL